MNSEDKTLVALVRRYGNDVDKAYNVYMDFIEKYTKNHNPLKVFSGHGSTLIKIERNYYQKRADVFDRYARIYHQVR